MSGSTRRERCAVMARRWGVRRCMRILMVAATGLVLTGAVVEAGDEYSSLAQAGTPYVPMQVPAAAPGRYVMRCWQYGRLLFEEALSQLPNEAGSLTIRLQGADRALSTYQLIDTRTAFCLVKPVLDKSGWPAAGLPGR